MTGDYFHLSPAASKETPCNRWRGIGFAYSFPHWGEFSLSGTNPIAAMGTTALKYLELLNWRHADLALLARLNALASQGGTRRH